MGTLEHSKDGSRSPSSRKSTAHGVTVEPARHEPIEGSLPARTSPMRTEYPRHEGAAPRSQSLTAGSTPFRERDSGSALCDGPPEKTIFQSFGDALRTFGDAWRSLCNGRPVSAMLQAVTGTVSVPLMAVGLGLMSPVILAAQTRDNEATLAVGLVWALPTLLGYAAFRLGEGACQVGKKLTSGREVSSDEAPARGT